MAEKAPNGLGNILGNMAICRGLFLREARKNFDGSATARIGSVIDEFEAKPALENGLGVSDHEVQWEPSLRQQ
jgi:hypothetical protein